MAPVATSPLPASATVRPTLAKRCLRILYADDLRELRDVARMSFTRDGHEIECFADGALAHARILVDQKFDLVITDHHMPNMNGLEFVLRLRELNFAGRIMVFSSELSETTARQYREQRVDRILYKPVFPSMLRDSLRELFPANV